MTTNFSKLVFTAEDRTREAFSSVQRGMGEITGAAGRLSGLLPALGAGLSAAGFAAFIKSSIDAADEMGKLSQKVGVSVESLSALKYAGDLSDVSLEQLGTGLKKLSVNMTDAARGTGDAKDAFQALGINVRGLSSDQVLSKVADEFSRMEDGAGKTALAIKLFGRSGADLIPLLNQGSAGLAAMRTEAERLGVVMSGDMAKAAEEFNDSMTRLKAQSSGLGVTLANTFLPALNQITESMGKTAKESGLLAAALIGLGEAFKIAFYDGGAKGNAVQQQKKFVTELENEMKNLENNLTYFKRSHREGILGDLVHGGSQEKVERAIATLKLTLTDARFTLADLENKALGFGQTGDSGQKKPAPAIVDEDEARRAAKKAHDALQKAFDENRRQDDRNRNVDFDIEWANIEQQSDVFIKQRDRIAALKEKYTDLIDPVQKYRIQLNEIDEAEQAGALSADAANEARFRVNDAIDGLNQYKEKAKETNDIGRELGLTFSSAFEDAIVSGKKFSDVLKSLAQDILKIFVRKSITEPLAKSAGKLFESIDWGSLLPSANGNVFSSPGLSAYSGQVVSKPTLFPFASGIGLMGEAGAEAILPLKRGSDGKLGVTGIAGGGITVNNYYTIDARGAEPGVEDRIRRSIAASENRAVDRAVSQVQNLNQRGQLRLS